MIRALALLLALAACDAKEARQLDLDLIHISPDAQLRTDAVGEGKFEERATFVLVDAANGAREGAYVTLTGELADASGAKVGELRTQSLWIPAGETRTFALVDRERQPRPTAASAKIHVRGAAVPSSPPPARVGELREIPDDGKLVVQGNLHNDAERGGQIVVIGAFHDAAGRPMTRPFAVLHVEPHTTQVVQFVSPPGAKRGTIFVGDAVY